jgi:prepilin-type N-terminal cleavage/methylation domain-containing protein
MRQRSSTSGFTLIEVMIALVILSGIVISMGHGTARYLSTITRNRIRVQAATVADAQIATMRVNPDYATLTATFNGTVNGLPFVGYSQVTLVVRTGAGTNADRTRVKVTVTGPQLATPVIRYTTIAAP